MNNETTTAIESYIEFIKESYRSWHEDSMSTSDIAERMIADFNKSIEYSVGKKYIKIITGGSVHSFIVNGADKKFSNGDVLKAASWNAPARNFARGNIFNLNSIERVRWTGA